MELRDDYHSKAAALIAVGGKLGCPDVAARLRGNKPNLKVPPFCADFWLTFILPFTALNIRGERNVGF
jgi:hypothetical protein